MTERIRIKEVKLLSDNWYTLKSTTFDYLRKNGEWQTQQRETYDRGNGAAILLYNLKQKTVILTKQFRFPAYVNGLKDGHLIEAAAGLLDKASPEERIKAEAEEETGYRVDHVRKVFEAYMSPGSVTNEGEDIEVLELSFQATLQMIKTGEIQDAKTIMLLQHAALTLFS